MHRIKQSFEIDLRSLLSMNDASNLFYQFQKTKIVSRDRQGVFRLVNKLELPLEIIQICWVVDFTLSSRKPRRDFMRIPDQ